MSILSQLEGVKQTLESLHSGGLDLASDIEAVSHAINLIDSIHTLVDGKECGADFTSDVIDQLVIHGLDVRSPDDIEEEE